MVEGLVQKHGFDSALVSVDWLKMGARIQAREEEVVVAMRAWKLVEEPVFGHWTFVGASEDLLACRSDWVPVVDKNGLPLCLPVAPLGAYSTVQLPGCGYKELFHRQLLQDLLGRQLPDNVDVHHRDGDKANNCGRNLEAMPRSYHRRLHLQQRP